MTIITFPPKKIKKNNDSITISRKEYKELLALKKIVTTPTREVMTEKDILRLSREAKKMKPPRSRAAGYQKSFS